MVRFEQWSDAEREIRRRREIRPESVGGDRESRLFYDWLSPDCAYRCVGFSMENTFCEGDLVFIHKQDTFSDGQIVAIQIGETITLKRLYKLRDGYRLVPDNREYNPVDICGSDAETVKIIGVAVGRRCGKGGVVSNVGG